MILAAIRAEWFKVIRRPALWITVILLLALSVTLEYVLVYIVVTHPPPTAARLGATLANLRVDLYPASVIKKTLANAAGLYGIFPLIVGVLVQGSEYGWGTVKTVQIQLPGRLAIVAGQLVSVLLLTLAMAVLLFAADTVISYGIAIFDKQSTTLPPTSDLVKGVGAAWLIFSFLAVFGYGLATVFRQSALAIGLGLGYVLVIENLVFGLLVNLGDTFKNAQELFPVANAGWLERAFGAVRAAAEATPPPVDATHSVIVLGVWLLAIAIVAAAVVKNRDVI